MLYEVITGDEDVFADEVADILRLDPFFQGFRRNCFQQAGTPQVDVHIALLPPDAQPFSKARKTGCLFTPKQGEISP